MGYKVKRGNLPTDGTVKVMLGSFFKRLLVTLIILSLMIAIGYFVFQYAYGQFPPFATAADDVIHWVKAFYIEHGVWATLGLLIAVCLGVWALGEESKKRDRRKQAMNEMIK